MPDRIDFLRPLPRWSPGALSVAAVGALVLLATLAAHWRAVEARDAAADALQARERARSPKAPPRDLARERAGARELARAQRVVDELAIPWAVLFAALEDASLRGVALAALDPESESGRLRVQGVARDYPTLARYIERLERTGALSDVHLVQSGPSAGADGQGGGGIAFVAAAQWLVRDGR